MKQGRRHYASWLFASHVAAGLDSAKPRTKRTQALGDRALPDLRASDPAGVRGKDVRFADMSACARRIFGSAFFTAGRRRMSQAWTLEV